VLTVHGCCLHTRDPAALACAAASFTASVHGAVRHAQQTSPSRKQQTMQAIMSPNSRHPIIQVYTSMRLIASIHCGDDGSFTSCALNESRGWLQRHRRSLRRDAPARCWLAAPARALTSAARPVSDREDGPVRPRAFIPSTSAADVRLVIRESLADSQYHPSRTRSRIQRTHSSAAREC